jgi:hypothetical protein
MNEVNKWIKSKIKSISIVIILAIFLNLFQSNFGKFPLCQFQLFITDLYLLSLFIFLLFKSLLCQFTLYLIFLYLFLLFQLIVVRFYDMLVCLVIADINLIVFIVDCVLHDFKL